MDSEIVKEAHEKACQAGDMDSVRALSYLVKAASSEEMSRERIARFIRRSPAVVRGFLKLWLEFKNDKPEWVLAECERWEVINRDTNQVIAMGDYPAEAWQGAFEAWLEEERI